MKGKRTGPDQSESQGVQGRGSGGIFGGKRLTWTLTLLYGMSTFWSETLIISLRYFIISFFFFLFCAC